MKFNAKNLAKFLRVLSARNKLTRISVYLNNPTFVHKRWNESIKNTFENFYLSFELNIQRYFEKVVIAKVGIFFL